MNNSFLKDMRFYNVEDGLDLLRSGGAITMSWGVSLITPLEYKGEVRGLAFNVNGNHFQGTVILSANFMDYYEVRFMKDGEIVEDMTMIDIFVMDAINLIDEKVEKLESYSY